MGTCIEAVATAHPGRWSALAGRSGSALHLSDTAARRCLGRGHVRADELDLLVNVGLYKDGNMAEPALAAIIQEDIGANPGHPPREGFHGTFSFDVLAGGCGFVTAAYLLDAFVGPGSAHRALIVAGDADPSPRTSRGFPFVSAGGAALLVHDDGTDGFQCFRFETFPEHAPLFEAALRWNATPRFSSHRNVLEVYEAPAFATSCIGDALGVAKRLLAGAHLSARDIDVLVASQYPRGFALAIARGLGIPTLRVPRVANALEGTHTAGPIAALEVAMASGALAEGRRALFVTVGAGITVGAALYVRAAEHTLGATPRSVA